MSVEQVGPGGVSNSYGVRGTSAKQEYDNDKEYKEVFVTKDTVPLTATVSSSGGLGIVNPIDGSPLLLTTRLSTGAPETTAALNTAIKLAPLPVVKVDTMVNAVSGNCAVDDNVKGMQITLYDDTLKRIAWTGWQTVPGVGKFRFAHHSVKIEANRQYFYGMACESATATFSETSGFGGFTTTYALPLPTTITTTTTATTSFPALTAEYIQVPMPAGFADISDTKNPGGAIRVLGVNKANSQPWGVDKTTSKIVYSDSSGNAWYQMMSAPMITRGMIDLIHTGTQLVVLCYDCSIWISSDLTDAATWTDITIPVSPGWRRSTATTRPYGIEIMDGHVMWGEYSSGDTLRNHPTDPAGPRLFKWKIATSGPWELAKTFPSARHIHSLWTQGTGLMFISVGDGTDVITGETLTDIGVWRCTDIINNIFQQKQNLAYDRRYPVDMVYKPGVGFMFASDAPGTYLQSMMRHTTSGSPILAQQVLIDGFIDANGNYYDDVTGVRGGNSRSVVIDNKNNVYVFSAEEAETWMIGIPPPYTHYVKLAKLPSSTLYRSVVSGTRLMIWDRIYDLGKWPGQK